MASPDQPQLSAESARKPGRHFRSTVTEPYPGAVLTPTSSTIRLFLHVVAASVWVGGQIVLGGLVPVLRRTAPEATKVVARAFARIAWPAFGVLVVTGLWNVAAVDVADTSTAYQVTLFVKVALSLTAAAAVAVHSIGQTKLAMALGGAVGLLASLGALFVGILLRTGLN